MIKGQTFRILAVSLIVGAATGLSGCADSDGEFDTGGGGGGGGGISNCQVDGTALCDVPGAGPEIVAGAGGSCPDNAGQLDATQLCQVPGVGPALVEQNCGAPCPDAGGGDEPPLSIEELCAIPTLGPQIVEGAGGSCDGVPPPDGGGDQCLPNQCDPTGNGCLSDIPGFEALVCP